MVKKINSITHNNSGCQQLHTSVPANPLIAEPLYLAGYIERLGTGTTDIVDKCLAAGLLEPRFVQAEDFKSILFRPMLVEAPTNVPDNDTPEVTPEVNKLILQLEGEMTRIELQHLLDLKDEKNFRENYLQKALKMKLIEMIIPDKPNSRNQKYRLTTKGEALKKILKKKKP
jgi:ATP-dependent DNA helicase RecG